ncbi:TetR/AcrR family transcriptional regulator [Nocardia macrotermitis]|uniref:HTH tetR-type domain-containing protein n=1 Tax=Nocardia macrotermitis TaxID=2585198 RepID=A0A7K0D350_9NOCA|nr:TetR/AcrR family transcriptional regulator [Nocardia macrotermitis]MQY20145.1 hypothetical protein [Nocardia macrotermitis]
MSADDRVITDLLVQTGLQLVIESPDRLLDGGLRTEEVINQANSAHATFYRKFGTRSRYVEEVLIRLVESTPPLPVDVREPVRAALAAVDGDRRRALDMVVQQHFDRVFDDNAGAHRLLAAACGPATQRTAAAMLAAHRRSDAIVLEIFDLLFAQSGATFRKPLTAKSFGVMLTALIDGLVLRHRTDPQAVTPELVTDAVLTVLNSSVGSTQPHTHIDDALAAITRSHNHTRTLPPEPRAALLEAARREFTKRGYFMTSMKTIAAEAGVPPDAAYRIFPTKAHIIAGALKPAYETLRQGIEDDLALGRDEIAVLENHFLRCARLVVAERALMDALMAVVAHDTYAEPEGLISIKRELSFPALLAPVIAQGQQSGVFADDQPAVELAALLTNTLLLRCFTRRNVSPEQNAAFVSGLTINGLRKS